MVSVPPGECSNRAMVRHDGPFPDSSGMRLAPSAPGADTPARSANVGARSMLRTRCWSVPGTLVTGSYRMMRGTRMLSSYGTYFDAQRCSPHRKPLSEANTIMVFASRPVSDRALRMPATASSTDSSVRYWSLRILSMAALSAEDSRGHAWTYAGLSDTSRSL